MNRPERVRRKIVASVIDKVQLGKSEVVQILKDCYQEIEEAINLALEDGRTHITLHLKTDLNHKNVPEYVDLIQYSLMWKLKHKYDDSINGSAQFKVRGEKTINLYINPLMFF